MVSESAQPATVTEMAAHNINGNVVQAGHIDVVHLHAVPSSVVWPVRSGVVPARAGCFQRRRGIESDDESSGAVVVSGMGGAGKTQVAADHAHRLWDSKKLGLLAWINATSRESITAEYAGLAAALGIDGGADGERAVGRLLAWLAATERRWLVVLDDLQSPTDLNGLWPPETVSGQTVVTTRRRDWALVGTGRRVVDLDVFTQDESVSYLTRALSARPGQIDGAAELAADLGRLPLALAQAAAFIADRPMLTCRSYRARFADQRLSLAELLPDGDNLPDQHARAVAATWSLSVSRADQLKPVGLAGPLLHLMSVLNPNGIPVQVLAAPVVLTHLGARTGHVVSVHDVNDALAGLYRLRLADLNVSENLSTAHVHALVQRAIRDSLATRNVAAAARAAADGLVAAWPETERDRQVADNLRANTQALADIAGDHLWAAGLHPVLLRAGHSLGEAGLITGAVAYYRRLAGDCAARLGNDHPDTLTVRHNVAFWQGRAGDPAGAAAAFADVAADRARILGPDHGDTLSALHYQARFHATAGDIAGAIPMFDMVVACRTNLLGPDHPETLTSRASRAFWRGESGAVTGAVSEMAGLVADRIRVLGPDHPDTLNSRANLARFRGEAGDPAMAVRDYGELVADRTRVLGPDHPDTLKARRSLAGWRGRAGNKNDAIAELDRLLADRLRLLGPDHPDTLATRGSLAYWQGSAGDPAAAALAFEALLADRLRVLGPDHPATLTTRANLARWRGESGDPGGAAEAMELLLADRLRVHGPDHRRTRLTARSLARWERLAHKDA